MVSVMGLHPDGWLDASSIFEVSEGTKIAWVVYLPPLPSDRFGKQVSVLVGNELHAAIVPRGAPTTLGPFVLGEAGARIGIDSAQAEPVDALDQRMLGLKLIRTILDDVEIEPTPSSDTAETRGWFGRWSRSMSGAPPLFGATRGV